MAPPPAVSRPTLLDMMVERASRMKDAAPLVRRPVKLRSDELPSTVTEATAPPADENTAMPCPPPEITLLRTWTMVAGPLAGALTMMPVELFRRRTRSITTWADADADGLTWMPTPDPLD